MNTTLKNRRKKAGLSQAAIAELADICNISYQRYESGERVPDVHTAQRIAKALNSTVEELFGNTAIIAQRKSKSQE